MKVNILHDETCALCGKRSTGVLQYMSYREYHEMVKAYRGIRSLLKYIGIVCLDCWLEVEQHSSQMDPLRRGTSEKRRTKNE